VQFPKCTQRRVNNANCTFPPRLSPPHHPATPGWQPPLSLGHAESWPHCGRTATRRAGRVIRPDIQRASDTIFTAFKTSTEEAVKESRSRRRREEEERGAEDLKENRQLCENVHSCDYSQSHQLTRMSWIRLTAGTQGCPHSDSHTTDAAISSNVPGHSEEPQSQCWSKNMILISG